ncbi:Uncharacterised protein [Vibrio cholerae]|nr:Uncharacterised protein [Vibrio cholerae]
MAFCSRWNSSIRPKTGRSFGAVASSALFSKPKLSKVANANNKLQALNSPISGACNSPSPHELSKFSVIPLSAYATSRAQMACAVFGFVTKETPIACGNCLTHCAPTASSTLIIAFWQACSLNRENFAAA